MLERPCQRPDLHLTEGSECDFKISAHQWNVFSFKELEQENGDLDEVEFRKEGYLGIFKFHFFFFFFSKFLIPNILNILHLQGGSQVV